MNRRGFLAGILASGVAPYVSTMAGVLMPVHARPRSLSGVTFLRENIGYAMDYEGRLMQVGPNVPRRGDLTEASLEDMVIEIEKNGGRGIFIRPTTLTRHPMRWGRDGAWFDSV